jgi:hypothetical protein
MTPLEVRKFYKTNYNFHKETGMSHNTLGNWLRAGVVPLAQQCKLEMITKGVLKADLCQGAKK